jgi:hypothetical protein
MKIFLEQEKELNDENEAFLYEYPLHSVLLPTKNK